MKEKSWVECLIQKEASRCPFEMGSWRGAKEEGNKLFTTNRKEGHKK